MAQGKFGFASAWLLVAGYNVVSNKFKEMRAKVETMLEDTTGAGDTYKEKTPVGITGAEVGQTGAYFDTQVGFIHDMNAAVPGALTPQSTPRVVCLGFAGITIGEPFYGCAGDFSMEYEVLSEVGALVRANLEHDISGQFDQGVILHGHAAAETADATTEPASSVDNTTVPQRAIPILTSSVANPSTITTSVAHGLTSGDTVLIAGHSGSTPTINGERTVTVVTATTFTIPVNVTGGGTGGTFTRGETNLGYAAYLQWTDLTLGGHTNALVTVRHSVDNSTFADLVSFTAATAARGSERKTAVAEVRRYLAQSVDFTGAGSPSMKYLVGLARL